MSISLYNGEPRKIKVRFDSDPLVPYSYTFNDITEVSMNFKQDTDEDLDTLYLEKLQSTAGVIVDNDGKDYSMVISSSDYGNIENGSYELVLAVQVNNINPFIEMSLQDPQIIVYPDKNRK